VEKIGFGIALRQCGICSKPQPLLQKTCIFHASETLATCTGSCLRTHAIACVCRAKATLVNLFPKIDSYSLKRSYFPF